MSDIEIGHRSTSTAILGNLAYRSGASVKWNGGTERIDGNKRASELLDKDYRKPWRLKV
jgi:hypothetical protein